MFDVTLLLIPGFLVFYLFFCLFVLFSPDCFFHSRSSIPLHVHGPYLVLVSVYEVRSHKGGMGSSLNACAFIRCYNEHEAGKHHSQIR